MVNSKVKGFIFSGLKWAAESISRYAVYYHAVVWGVPLVKTTLLLLLSAVEGDNVAGICYVGVRQNWFTTFFYGFLETSVFLAQNQISWLHGN